MKKLMTILAFTFVTALIAPSCSSDESFEDVVINSDLDQTYNTDDHKDDIVKP